MKKTRIKKTVNTPEDMLPEYNFRGMKGVRGKYYQAKGIKGKKYDARRRKALRD